MSLKSDVSAATKLLEQLHQSLQNCSDNQEEVQCTNDLNTIISVLHNPVLKRILSIKDAIGELKEKVGSHPSLLPSDFDITEEGEFIHFPSDDEKIENIFPDPVGGLGNSNQISQGSQSNCSTPNDDAISSLDSTENRKNVIESSHTTTPTYVNHDPEEDSIPTTVEVEDSFQAFDEDLVNLVQISAQGREVHHLQLYKQEGTTLGFSVVGLKSEQRGDLGIYVQDIQANGIAGQDGRLQDGDQILAIDGQVLDSFISHQEAISILQRATKVVDLFVARAPTVQSEPEDPTLQRQRSVENPFSATLIVPPSSESHTSNMLNTEWAQVEVIQLSNDGSGLGFGIIGGRSTGVVVKTILPGGVADREGRLQAGDHILQIGDVNLRGMGSDQVAAVLRQAGTHVRLVVARPVESASPDLQMDRHAPIIETRILNDPDEFERHLSHLTNGYPTSVVIPGVASTSPHLDANDAYRNLSFLNGESEVLTVLKPPFSGSNAPSDITTDPPAESPDLPISSVGSFSKSVDSLHVVEGGEGLSVADLPEMENIDLSIAKDYHGLGITIAGYVCEREELSGIFVKSITAGSAADRYGQIQVNDQIIEVDGCTLSGLNNHAAVEVLRSTGQTVHLKLARYLRGPKFEQLQQAIANSEMKSAPTTPNPSRAAVAAMGASEDIAHLLGSIESLSPELERTSSAGSSRSHHNFEHIPVDPNSHSHYEARLEELELLIDNDFIGPLKAPVESAIRTKWSRLVDHEMDIIVAQLSKFETGGGLGISLEGTVDVEDGKEVRPHHYIRSILPDGPVGRNCSLQRGDELLEVNNRKLLGLNHVEVVTILKELPQFVRLVCGRKNILPLQYDDQMDYEEQTAKNILGGSLQNLSPVSERLVKAKSDGSLASSATATNSDNTSLSKIKSRSLEPLSGLAMWSEEPQDIELIKGERGLGFSILDYQDPLNLQDTVIVIRSLVPGGVAEKDGRLIPGDRLIAVNGILLNNASLDTAVAALKGAQKGLVLISVAKPVGVLESPGQLDAILRESKDSENSETQVSAKTMEEGQNFRNAMVENNTDLLSSQDQMIFKGSALDTDKSSSASLLPKHLLRSITIQKRKEQLGINIETVEPKKNGVIITSIAKGGAVHLDGRLKSGDFLLSVNDESLRNINSPQARAVIKRTQLVNSDVRIVFICGQEAAEFRRSILLSQRADNFTEDAGDKLDVLLGGEKDLTRSSTAPCFVTHSKSIDETDYRCVQVGDPRSQLPPATDDPEEKPFTIIFRNLTEATKSNTGESSPEANVHALKSERLLDTRQLSEDIMQSDTSSCMDGRHWGPERTVDVKRDEKGSLGISIVGGKVDLSWSGSSVSGIFVKNVLPMSPAGKSGLLKTGDRILEVEGVDLRTATHERAVEVIKNTGNAVTFVVQSLVQWATTDSMPTSRGSSRLATHLPEPVHPARTPSPELIQAGFSDEKKQAFQEKQMRQPSIARQLTEKGVEQDPDSQDSDDEEDTRQFQGRITIDSGQEIDRGSAGALPATAQEIELNEQDMFGYTARKVKKKYDKLDGTVLLLDVQKGDSGLGITLAGHKDRTQMAAFVCGLNPSGNAYKDGRLQISDEIIEVNGQVVQGISHLNVSKIFKQFAGPLFKIIIRRLAISSGSKMAVKKVTHFPITFQEESEEEKYSRYPGVVKITLNKGQSGLGIMIIEGTHPEVGRGIFVSDLQQGSVAAESGILVGDLLLSVNKEDMIEMEYEAATTILKRLEGVVVMWVANVKRVKPKETSTDPKAQSATANDQPKAEAAPAKLDPQTDPIVPGQEITIEVKKNKVGLGLSIVGGSDTLLGAIIIHEVYTEGAAFFDGRLQPGDLLLEVNNENFRATTHQRALSALRQTPSKVKMVVYREETSKEEDMYDVLAMQLVKKSGKGLGLSIVGRKNAPGVFISDLVPGGVAESDGRLMQGDQIFEVNEHDLRKSTQEEAAAILKCAPTSVSLKVARLKPGKNNVSRANVSKGPTDDFIADVSMGSMDHLYSQPSHLLSPQVMQQSYFKQVSTDTNNHASESLSLIRSVVLDRGEEGLGFSIVGGYGSNLGDLPIYVKSVFERGAASKEGSLQRGDQILKVDGRELTGLTHAQAVSILKEARGTVILLVLPSKA